MRIALGPERALLVPARVAIAERRHEQLRGAVSAEHGVHWVVVHVRAAVRARRYGALVLRAERGAEERALVAAGPPAAEVAGAELSVVDNADVAAFPPAAGDGIWTVLVDVC